MRVDLLIIGGGVQGLTLLRDLSKDYSAVLVGTNLRDSETLHSHGYFSSGWGAADLDAARAYRQAAAWWREYFQEHGLASQQNPFHAALPLKAVSSLKDNWKKAGIPFKEEPCARPFDLSGLPPHGVFHFPEDLVFSAAGAIQKLKEPISDFMLEGRMAEIRVTGHVVKEVTVKVKGQTLTFAPSFVLAACGAGNATILKMLGLPEGKVARSQMVRPLYMVCAQGEGLPEISGFFLDLLMISHHLENGKKLWLITYNPPEPKFTEGVIDMSRDPTIEPWMVRASLEKLANILPNLVLIASRCQWGVYAGWKTDAPGGNPQALLNLEYPKPYDVQSFGLKNFLAIWPNHWCLSTLAAKDASEIVQEKLRHGVDRPKLPAISSREPEAAKMKWVRSDRQWQSWVEFSGKYGFTG